MNKGVRVMISILVIGGAWIESQELPVRPVATYSIVALDPETGQLGVAVQSHWFSVGSVVSWAEAGVGAVATQSFVKVDYGPEGLKLMREGLTAQAALTKLLAEDPGEAVRQVAMVDIRGHVAVHTGSRCIDAAGHATGKTYSVQANLMENSSVWPAMAEAFESASGDLADRMMAALEAAQDEGGDIRGRQSASMLIVRGKPTGVPWKDVVLNLRVEDAPEPLKELKRLIRIHRAYDHANRGDKLLETGDVEGALKEYDAAARLYPENVELPFWSAVTLASGGRLSEALPIFKSVFEKDERWRKLTPRLVKSNLLPDDAELMEAILNQ
ncbi:MAG: DUF1028 domain-containing protein [Fidelibacterota bacterium]